MAAATAGTKVSLTVANFGPLEHAEIDLRPFTVFVGPSNTGKSYLAILLYALHRCFGRDRDLKPSLVDRVFRHDWGINPLGKALGEVFWAWIRDSRSKKSVPPMPQVLADHVGSILQENTVLNSELEDELERCFLLNDIRELCRIQSDKESTSFTLKTRRPVGSIPFAYNFRFGVDGGQLQCQFGDVLPQLQAVRGHLSYLEQAVRVEEDIATEIAFTILIGQFQSDMLSAIPKAYYLPAGRTGVMHSPMAAVRPLIPSATAGSRRKFADVPIVSGVFADFLESLITIGGADRRPRRTRESVGLEEHIERDILNGVVQVDKSKTKYPAFVYRPNGWSADLPLVRASSMVSELAPLVLYTQYLIEPGDLMIIEEPEAHLHPAMQAEVTRALARSVRRGLRVVITTHSEWVVEALGNLVQLSAVPQEGRSGLPGEDCALSPDQVGIWLFDQDGEQGGVTLKEVELDAESGLYATGFDDVSEALYNDNARIFNRRQEFQGK